MNELTLTETADRLVYDCTSTGIQVTVMKAEDVLDVRQVTPQAATPQTWQSIRDELAPKVTP